MDKGCEVSFKSYAMEHFRHQMCTNRNLGILTYILKTLKAEQFPVVSIIQSGSLSSRTSILGKSDLDILLLIEMGDIETNRRYFKELVFSIDGILSQAFKINFDYHLDIPAIVIRDLENKLNTSLDITPAVRAKSFGIGMPCKDEEYDTELLIIQHQFKQLVFTNPQRHKAISSQINDKSNNMYSLMAIIIKTIKYNFNLNITSFCLEVFIYYWMRDVRSSENYLICNRVVNDWDCEEKMLFEPRKVDESLILNCIQILECLAERLQLCSREKCLFKMSNPFVIAPNENVGLTDTIEKQKALADRIQQIAALLLEIYEEDNVAAAQSLLVP